jgi:hypothetical protein
VTEARREAGDSTVLREVIRRSGHEIRNALSGVAVNLEVVRSRCSRDPNAAEVLPFADRARLEIHSATVLTNGLLAVLAAAVRAQNEQTGKPSRKSGESAELALNGDLSAVFSDIQQLAGAISVSIEQRGPNVILKVLPEGHGHFKD